LKRIWEVLAGGLCHPQIARATPARRQVQHGIAQTCDEIAGNQCDLALVGFGYWHYGLLLGVVSVAAGLKKAVGDPYDPLGTSIGSELALGVALFVACTAGFAVALGLGFRRERIVAAGLALATIPVGTEWTAAAEIAALTAIVVGALLLEARRHASNS